MSDINEIGRLHFPRPDAERSLLAAVVESSDDAIITKDLNGVITSWNRGAEIVFGYEAEEMVGRSVMILIPEWLHDEEPGILEKIRNAEKIDHYETVRRRKDGTLIETSLTVSPNRNRQGEIIGASKIARDISSRTLVQTAMKSADRLARIVDAQESTRNRIARDLHDHLGQKMTGLRLSLERLIDEYENRDAFRVDFEAVKAAAEQIDQDLGFLSWELRPTEMEQVGLIDALRSYFQEWSRQYAIPAVFHTPNRHKSTFTNFGQSIEINVYRVVQEALNNIFKHADASKVALVVRVSDVTLTIVIEDDGMGFDPEVHKTESGPSGVGLSSMQERIALIGGEIDIESRLGGGTCIIVRVPVGPDSPS